jgi:hypothetical protein
MIKSEDEKSESVIPQNYGKENHNAPLPRLRKSKNHENLKRDDQ